MEKQNIVENSDSDSFEEISDEQIKNLQLQEEYDNFCRYATKLNGEIGGVIV